jgi:hypothetical protein
MKRFSFKRPTRFPALGNRYDIWISLGQARLSYSASTPMKIAPQSFIRYCGTADLSLAFLKRRATVVSTAAVRIGSETSLLHQTTARKVKALLVCHEVDSTYALSASRATPDIFSKQCFKFQVFGGCNIAIRLAPCYALNHGGGGDSHIYRARFVASLYIFTTQ